MRTALEDPAIMGNAFAGDSWLPWRALAIAAHGEELSTKERTVFTELTGRAREPLEPKRDLDAEATATALLRQRHRGED